VSRPLLITDCDEVLLHMVAPFAGWVDEVHDIHFNFETGDFVDALRHKANGEPLETPAIWPLLKGFFETEMHRQKPIDGAIPAIQSLAEHADIVVLTNLTDDAGPWRAAQLRALGIDLPVYTNQGGKGEVLTKIVADYMPSVTVFVDDLIHQHESVAKHAPDVWRLHMVGEPLLAPNVPKARHAHARIDDWSSAQHWIRARFAGEPINAD
jgi:hypothetical protein